MHNAYEESQRPVESAEAVAADTTAGGALRNAWTDFRGMMREHAYLAVLEAQRAGLHLAYVLAAVLVVSVLLVTAWLALVTGLVVWMTAHIGWPAILVVAAVLNLAVAAAVAWWVKQRLTHLPFSATLRQLAASRRDITTRRTHAKPS